MQGFDRANTGYNPEGTPLRSDPAVTAQVDVPAGHTADYLQADGTLYIHSEDNSLGAVEAGTGDLLWAFDEAESPLIPQFVEGDVLLARALGGNVFAIDRNDGSLVADRPTEQGYGVAPGTTGQYFAPISGGSVIAGEGGKTEPAWETSVEGTGVRPAFADGRVFVSTVELSPEEINFEDPAGIDAGGRLYALDAEDGSVLWERGRRGGGLAPPTVQDGTVYWTGSDGDILTADAATGDSEWEVKTDNSFNTSAAVVDDLLFAGNDDGGLYVIDTASGEQVARAPLDGPIHAGPVVVGDVAYAGTTTGSVAAVDYTNGNMLWDFAVDTPIRALAVWENRAVIGTDSGYHVLNADDASNGGATTTGDGTAQDWGGGTDTGGTTDGDTDGSGTEERQRGLFSNSASGEEPEFISNAFNLTMLGFLLSVAGIVHQMLQGR
jgi:outer membrane protein assembly factor BamB